MTVIGIEACGDQTMEQSRSSSRDKIEKRAASAASFFHGAKGDAILKIDLAQNLD